MKRTGFSFGAREGQASLMVVAGMGALLIAAIGMAVDGGQMYAQRQMAQTAADAAAEAGMLSILRGTNATSTYPFGTGATPIPSSVCTTTDGRTPCFYARSNGFGGTAADTVTLSYPATVSGVNLASGTVPAFSVTVQRNVPLGLTRFLKGAHSGSITAKGTAGLIGKVSTNCVYVLDATAQNAFSVSNGAAITLNGCAMAVDSSNATAASITGGASVTASAINVTGGVAINNGGSAHPTPTTGVTAAVDPLASLPSPAVGACNYTNYSPGWGTWTLNPGTYCGGININNGATATFNPGVYIINGGSLTLGGGTTNTGTGVMFFLTGTNITYGSVNIANGVNVTFTGPTSGAYQGVVFYQNRAINSAVQATFAGGATMKITGTLYFPTTTVSFSNGAVVANYSTAIVADKVSFTGGTSIKYDPTGLLTGLITKGVALVQ